MEFIVYGLAGFGMGIGILACFLLYFRKESAAFQKIQVENSTLTEQLDLRKNSELRLRDELKQADNERIRFETLNEELQKKLQEQLHDQKKAAEHMQERFENLANKILDQKSAKFTEANQQNIKSLLEPLDKDLRNFRKKVEDIHEKDLSQHASLKEFLTNLQTTQSQLSEEARNLTTALKGDAKKQGDWGEFILQRTLEASGLVKGLEFSMQESFDR